jgi:hypothetical protein
MSRDGTARPSRRQIREAIRSSGYVLEVRVTKQLERAGWVTSPNSWYPDPETRKLRELDVVAKRLVECDSDTEVESAVLIECKNNALPIVFFTRPPTLESEESHTTLVSGFPLAFQFEWNHPLSYADVVWRHDGSYVLARPIATQYCSLQERKGAGPPGSRGWMALHSAEQHESISALRDAAAHQMELHYEELHALGVDLLTDDHGEDYAFVTARLYRPAVVLGGEMLACTVEGNRLALRRERHVRLLQDWRGLDPRGTIRVGIDVLCEAELPNYLDCVHREAVRLATLATESREATRTATADVADELRRASSTVAGFRRVIEQFAVTPRPDELADKNRERGRPV